jgi:hypothetical protein
VALQVLLKQQPEGAPSTVLVAKRLECYSAVSSRLCDIAHSKGEQADKKNYLLKVGKLLVYRRHNFYCC